MKTIVFFIDLMIAIEVVMGNLNLRLYGPYNILKLHLILGNKLPTLWFKKLEELKAMKKLRYLKVVKIGEVWNIIQMVNPY